MTSPAPDLPDFTGPQQPVTVPTLIGVASLSPGQFSQNYDLRPFTSYAIIQTGLVVLINAQEKIQFNPTSHTNIAANNTFTATSTYEAIGDTLQLQNLSGTSATTVQIVGFGRSTKLTTPVMSGSNPEIWNGQVASQLWTVGETTALANVGLGRLPQGPVFLYFRTNIATLTGELLALTSVPATGRLLDTGECHNTPATGLAVGKMCAIPANVDHLAFKSQAAVTGAVFVDITPAY